MIGQLVTGAIIGCLGRADINGIFFVENFVFAEHITTPNVSSDTNFDLKRSIFDRPALQDPNRRFVAIISGLELGLPQDQLSIELMQRFFRGDTGSYEE